MYRGLQYGSQRGIMKQWKENVFVPFLFSSGELLISTMTRDFCFIGEVFPVRSGLVCYTFFLSCFAYVMVREATFMESDVHY